MLKWTASAQKLPQDTPKLIRTPSQLRCDAKRSYRRATIANKENIPMVTSTPMAKTRQRNSPLMLTPLGDIPAMPRTPERNNLQRTRRHSTLGITVPVPVKAGYASTLPRYEEEYSPSAALPTGQQLALRGLLPDPFLGNPRYFRATELTQPEQDLMQKPALPKKRKLEQEFSEIAQEAVSHKQLNATAPSSTRMGDQTLDHLIDAILDSARKEEKKRKPRKSFNLRRRTLLRNQAESVSDLKLSPSYTPCDDPADDLSFAAATITPTVVAVTPQPVTPPAGFSLTASMLCKMPTPTAMSNSQQLSKKRTLNDTFMLETPVRSLTQKPSHQQQLRPKRASLPNGAAPKRYKVDARNYFEIGLALPSIYV